MTEEKAQENKIGMVTHVVYNGLFFHVLGAKDEVRKMIDDKAKALMGEVFIDLPTVDIEGNTHVIAFSIYSSIMVLDDHMWKEGKETTAGPSLESGAGVMKI